MRPNKLEHLPLVTLSRHVLELRVRPEPTQLEHVSDASFLGKLLVFSAIVRLYWKLIASTNTLAYFCLINSVEGKMFYNFGKKGLPGKTL